MMTIINSIISFISDNLLQIIGWGCGAAILLLCKSIFNYLIKLYYKRKNNEFNVETLRDNAYADFNIRQYLARLLGSIGCDRVNIFTWHNGNHDSVGVPFRKMSCVYEYTREGVSKELATLKNFELSEYPELFGYLLNNIDSGSKDDNPIIICVNKLDNCSFKSMLLKMGIHCIIIKLIRLRNRTVNYGFLLIGNMTQCGEKKICNVETNKDILFKNIKEISSIIEDELVKRK